MPLGTSNIAAHSSRPEVQCRLYPNALAEVVSAIFAATIAKAGGPTEDVLVDTRGNIYITDKQWGLFILRYSGRGEPSLRPNGGLRVASGFI